MGGWTFRNAEPSTLVRVVPIGQTHSFDGGKLLVLSAEEYDEGCIVHCRIILDRQDADPPHPFPMLQVRDSNGRRFGSHVASAVGDGVDYAYRLVSNHTLDPSARLAVLEFLALWWVEDLSARRQHPVREQELGWSIEVSQ